ncbi:Na(+)-translocating NADH-quinone reductase subunit A [Epibacterium sp. SM1979]|uniref:Na(+)-translocating NADH-quinone reductase subunit A n=1 Tax=Tritonibacter litoralis TaxID=2662264 RepID=A0A843YJF7_9RHOB|nr:Na(+)-translocating NADH-quinone reductase subunit A [Tritonibacter litoralis]MQQ09795.1 Na(+)-translocating NADH-quinone reductase subunit A [Tritonibacter litoralis]
MKRYNLRKGLDLRIIGAPRLEIQDSEQVQTAAVLGDDYIDLKPRIVVAEGDVVVPGTPVLFDKNMPEAQVVSPVAGRVRAINRGARRKLVSVEIDIDPAAGEALNFSDVGDASTRDGLVERLCAAGLWTSFRTRPYSKVPAPDTTPAAIYVTAADSEPLAMDPAIAIQQEAEAFTKGLEAVAALSGGKTYLCQGDGEALPGHDLAGVEAAAFVGPHPSGLAGTHMHFLEAPTAQKTVWTIGYHDVIVIGRLMLTGTYDPSRVIALTGPLCKDPRLVRVPAGAAMADLLAKDLPQDLPVRIISGSILSGRAGEGASGYLGRYARQITVIEEDKKQIPMGWIRPMFSKFAVQPVLGSALSKRAFPLTSNLNGGRRAMVPLGTFEELMPQDFLPTQLLRALLVMDTDQAQLLGALELDEEDLGLVGFACPAKYEYGMALRDCLTKIEKEG